jgi:hypothetical protein
MTEIIEDKKLHKNRGKTQDKLPKTSEQKTGENDVEWARNGGYPAEQLNGVTQGGNSDQFRQSKTWVLVGDSREFPSFSFLSTSHKERCSVYF